MKLPEEWQNKFSSLILFDGVCNVCNALTAFMIKRDPAKKFRYASLQGPTGQRILKALGLPSTDLNTMIYIRGENYFLKSTSAFEIFRNMPGLWPLLYPFVLVPAPLRNAAYDIIARNRYRWFGKKDACLVPTPDIKDRFVE